MASVGLPPAQRGGHSEDSDLDYVLRTINAAYSPKNRQNVRSFLKNTLQGEYKDIKSTSNDLFDVFDLLKAQGQIGPTNTELISYLASNANRGERFRLKELVNTYKNSEQKYQDDKDFVGRHEDMKFLLTSIKDEKNRVINVYGKKGVGKTTLVNRLALNLVDNNDKQVFTVDLQQAQDIFTIISSILLTFKVNNLVDPSPHVVFSLVENIKKPSVLVLDNLSLMESKDPEKELETFLKFLDDVSGRDKKGNLVILVTSHFEIPGDSVKNYKLDALSSSNSAELLEKVNRSTREDISSICDNTPLYLQATSAVLRENLVEPQDLLETFHPHRKNDSTNILIKAFEVFSVEMKRVAIKLLLFQTPFTVKMAASVLKCPDSEAEAYLGILRRRHFLSLLNEKYVMHSLAKEILTKKAKEKNYISTYNSAQQTFTDVFMKKALDFAKLLDKDYIKMYRKIMKEKPNLQEYAFNKSIEKWFMLTSSQFIEITYVLMIAECLQPSGTRAETFRRFQEAALNEGDLASFIEISSKLALVLLEKTSTKSEARDLLTQISTTLTNLNEVNEAYPSPDISRKYNLAKASYSFAMGEIALSDFHNQICTREEFERGMSYHYNALLTREKLMGDHTETTRSLNAMGNCCMEIQDYERALHYYTKAREMRQRLSGDKVHIDSPTYLNQIAVVHEEMGKKYKNQSAEAKMPDKKLLYEKAKSEFFQAVKGYQDALHVAKQLYLSGSALAATFYRNLSNVYSFLEQHDESYSFAKKALTMRKKILGIDVNTVRSYYQVAVECEWLGEDEKALKYYYKAYNMERKLPDGERSRVKLKIEKKIRSLLGTLEEAVEFGGRSDESAMVCG